MDIKHNAVGWFEIPDLDMDRREPPRRPLAAVRD